MATPLKEGFDRVYAALFPSDESLSLQGAFAPVGADGMQARSNTSTNP
ncbi:MAG: hypothetical protein ACJ8G3_25385 [Burkholderiaceae bacterium]